MKGIIDRFEGKYAVIEVNGRTRDVLRSQVDLDAAVGDVVHYLDGRWIADAKETSRRGDRIKKQMDDVWED